jgi:hypothetical protein
VHAGREHRVGLIALDHRLLGLREDAGATIIPALNRAAPRKAGRRCLVTPASSDPS